MTNIEVCRLIGDVCKERDEAREEVRSIARMLGLDPSSSDVAVVAGRIRTKIGLHGWETGMIAEARRERDEAIARYEKAERESADLRRQLEEERGSIAWLESALSMIKARDQLIAAGWTPPAQPEPSGLLHRHDRGQR